MKLPTTIDLRIQGAKTYVEKIIATYGQSKSINEVGLEVQCKDEAGTPFRLTQFNGSRHLVTIGT